MSDVSDDRIWRTLLAAHEAGVKLEYVAGVGVWEPFPGYRHQSEIDRIRATMRHRRPGELDVAGVYVRFPDGSYKRPDIAIFCREPDEQETAVTLLPDAVVEILSPGFEAKDTEVGAPFYLAQGVKDVILFDPRTKAVTHLRRDGERALQSPAIIELECGCVCEV